jgi:hypothetical protein
MKRTFGEITSNNPSSPSRSERLSKTKRLKLDESRADKDKALMDNSECQHFVEEHLNTKSTHVKKKPPKAEIADYDLDAPGADYLKPRARMTKWQ